MLARINLGYTFMIAVDLDSSVGVAIVGDWTGPGIESRWGARFLAPV
jgi:hypothetical protein